jgi:DNA helicase-2/ATP-dependent DNA helicase PcrA
MSQTHFLKPEPIPAKPGLDYRAQLNDEQYEVVVSGDGPCLVLAGAGSGKTRALTYRVAYLLDKGVKPNRILLVTFTNKAAKEMMSRIETICQNKINGLWGGTFHGVANRVLRLYGRPIGIAPNFKILDEEDAKDLVKSAGQQVGIPADKYFPKTDLIRKLISLSANLSEPIGEVFSKRFGQLNREYLPIIEAIAKLYAQKKKSASALDYDDLLSQWLRLLIEAPEVRAKLAAQFQYILVDEYQDTNRLQGEIIKHLAGEHQNILVVGDDAQSIYSFRGADVNNIFEFPKVFSDCRTFKLETNYRSTPEILELANESIKNNEHKFEKKLKTNKESAGKPVLVSAADSAEQAEFVAQKILDLQCDEGLELEQVAVLFRAHYQSLELELELNKRGIPYVMRGGLRFFEQAHIKDVMAYLKILTNFQDELSWQRLLRLQDGIGPSGAQKIWEQVQTKESLSAVLKTDLAAVISQRQLLGWNRVKELLQKLSAVSPEDITSQINLIIEGDYSQYLKTEFENAADRLEDLKQLAVFAEKYDSRADLLADVALSENFKGERGQAAENSGEAITLSTIHQAKGLEWRVVFVIGLADGQFPNAKALDDNNNLEEERRLFYVAVTRAEQQLFLTYPIFNGYGGNSGQLSQFIRELPAEIYDELHVSSADDWDNETVFEANDSKKEKKYKDLSDNDLEYIAEEEGETAAAFWDQVIKKRNKK